MSYRGGRYLTQTATQRRAPPGAYGAGQLVVIGSALNLSHCLFIELDLDLFCGSNEVFVYEMLCKKKEEKMMCH